MREYSKFMINLEIANLIIIKLVIKDFQLRLYTIIELLENVTKYSNERTFRTK